MLLDESYEVRTHWGWFRLDRGAYEDYLAGKLWITYIPGKPKEQAAEHMAANALYQIEVDGVKSVTFDRKMVEKLNHITGIFYHTFQQTL